MASPRPWRLERNAAGNLEIINANNLPVTKAICIFGKDGTPEAYTAIDAVDAELIVEIINDA